MSRLKTLLCCLLAVLFSQIGRASDLEKAPPDFTHLGRNATFVDFSNVQLNLTFDVSKQKALGHAVIEFEVAKEGMPIFDLIPSPTEVTLDGEPLELTDVYSAQDPNKQSKIRIIGVDVKPGEKHKLEIRYDLSSEVSFSGDAVGAGFFMDDLTDRSFWEQYAPSNFEYDQYKQTVSVEVLATKTPHEIFANGSVLEVSPNKWLIDYPNYYTTSSFYFHLVYKGRFTVARSSFQGVNGEIPLTVYSQSQSNATKGLDKLKGYLEELEGTYGAFAHNSFTAYITEGGGGMEYCGATVTSLWALGHETTHSWFARGVMPSSGNAGWIDEAVASWRDNDYPRGSSPSRTPRLLSGFSPYRRHTTMDAYSYGADLISDFDGLIARNNEMGMKGVLRQFFAKFQRQTITVPMFQVHLEEALGYSLKAFFDKYIYGKTSPDSIPSGQAGWDVNWSRHPRPFTKEEIALLR